VFDSVEALSHAASGGDAGGGGNAGDALAEEETPSQLIGLDLNTEMLQGIKKRLFAPAAFERERRMAAEARAPMAQPVADDTSLDPRRPELRVRTVTTAHGTFGHLRIDTFLMKDLHPDNPDVGVDIKEFIDEVQRLLPLMPKQGLILDVRGNPGEYVKAAETLLQFLTPRRIQPEPTQFISTRMAAELCEQVRGLQPWGASINASIETGAQYSSAIPSTTKPMSTRWGSCTTGPSSS
jgi:Peptidase family S41